MSLARVPSRLVGILIMALLVATGLSGCSSAPSSMPSTTTSTTLVNKAAAQLVPPSLAARGVLKIGVAASSSSGEGHGTETADRQLARQLAMTLGLRAAFIVVPEHDLVSSVADGTVDVAIDNLVDTASFEQHVALVDYLTALGGGAGSLLGIAAPRGGILTEALASGLNVMIASGSYGQILAANGLTDRAVSAATIDAGSG